MPVPHSNLKQYTTIVTIKVSNELAFSWMWNIVCSVFKIKWDNLLVFLARKRRRLRDSAVQRSLTSINFQRKTNQTIKERFLLKNYVAPVIFKRWWSNDVYIESYKQKAIINTTFFNKLKNAFKVMSQTFFK